MAIVLLLVVGAWWFAHREDPRSLQHLTRVAAEMNQTVPVMIDPETELLPVTVAPALLTYNYRLVSYSAAQIDPKRFAAGAKQRVTESACERPETRDEFLKNGVTLRYAYFDKDKKPITSVDVTPKDCGF
jgi:hypothetical protein